MLGKSRNESALLAGAPHAQTFDKSETVKREIAEARKSLSDLTQLKRLDTIDGIMDGIAMARMQGDAGNVIKGWTEVGKILGHYAPEVKKVELTVAQGRVRQRFESLSDEELLAIQNGEAVIDVDAKEISD